MLGIEPKLFLSVARTTNDAKMTARLASFPSSRIIPLTQTGILAIFATEKSCHFAFSSIFRSGQNVGDLQLHRCPYMRAVSCYPGSILQQF